MTNYLRPDEQATNAEIARSQERDRKLKNVGKAVGSVFLGTGGAALSSRIMPFLNHYIPTDLAIKGISKVSPKVGDFLKKGMKEGLDINEGFEFLRKSFGGKEEKQEPLKEFRNIIEQESPELHQFIDQEIKKGRKPIEAGAIAYNKKEFTNAINKLKNSHKVNWGKIIEMVYGNGEQAIEKQTQQQALAEEAMNPPGSSSTRPPSAEAQAAMQLQQQQSGQGQQALMAILQKIQQSRGG